MRPKTFPRNTRSATRRRWAASCVRDTTGSSSPSRPSTYTGRRLPGTTHPRPPADPATARSPTVSAVKLPDREYGTVTTPHEVVSTIETDDQSTKHRTMILLAMILTVWAVLSVLVIGVCWAARLGDRSQQEPLPPIAPHPAPSGIRRRRALS